MDVQKFIFHIIAFAVSVFATSYNYFVIRIGREGMGGKFKYLTFWNMCFQSIYFGYCLLVDLLETKPNPVNPNQRGSLQRVRDVLHSCIVFPTTMFVAVTFWTLFTLDRELVFPKALDAIFPSWLNHLMHTTILPFILVDKLMTHHHYPSRLQGFSATSCLALLYLIWILLIAYLDNFWVYPILEVLSMVHRSIFISVCVAFFASFYILGESVTIYLWGKPLVRGKSSSKSKKSSKKTR